MTSRKLSVHGRERLETKIPRRELQEMAPRNIPGGCISQFLVKF